MIAYDIMKAAVFREFGGPEVLKIERLPLSKPASDELVVKVVASSVNPLDCQVRRGDYVADTPLPCITGHDVSGVVMEVGERVENFKAGDEVYYTVQFFKGYGSYAEFHVVNEGIVARKPRSINHLEAASLPLVAGTAWEMLVTRGAIKPGETVLVHAGAGGVGTITIQLAKALGAIVFTTARSENFEMLKRLGADHMIDYRHEDYKKRILAITNGLGVDIVIDTIGGQTLSESPEVLAPLGRVVTIVDIPTPQNLIQAWMKNATYHFVFTRQNRHKLDSISRLVDENKIIPVIDSVFPLDEVGEAHRRIETSSSGVSLKGKIVLSMER